MSKIFHPIVKLLLTALLILSAAGSAMCLPSTFDWRDVNGTNYVTPVRYQGNCGSCGIFAAVAGVESNILIEHPEITDIDLAEDFYVSDCHTGGDCYGSLFGNILSPIQYLGIPLESCDPYEAINSPCNCCQDWQDEGWMIETRTNLGHCSTDYYKNKLMEYGPMPAEMEQSTWYYPDTTRHGYHGVLIVGWNDSEGVWIAKNSYGVGWGDDGYGKILFDTLGENEHDVYILSGSHRIYDTCPADVTGDGFVNNVDLDYVFDCWGNYESPADVSGPNYGIPDLTVDIWDLAYVEDNFGMCPGGTPLCGDVTGEGIVNMGDVVLLFNNVTYQGTPAYYIINYWSADVTGDGNVNMADVTVLCDHVTYGTPSLCCLG